MAFPPPLLTYHLPAAHLLLLHPQRAGPQGLFLSALPPASPALHPLGVLPSPSSPSALLDSHGPAPPLSSFSPTPRLHPPRRLSSTARYVQAPFCIHPCCFPLPFPPPFPAPRLSPSHFWELRACRVGAKCCVSFPKETNGLLITSLKRPYLRQPDASHSASSWLDGCFGKRLVCL